MIASNFPCEIAIGTDLIGSDTALRIGIQARVLLQAIHLHRADARRAVYTLDYRGVITRLQCDDDGRFGCVGRRELAILNIRDLIARNGSANLCRLPIVILGNEAIGVVQFQSWIRQGIRNAELSKGWTYGSDNYF